MSERTAVVGAGLAGLVVARGLADAGDDVRLFEKARGPGGRISARRTDFGAFDHGAQYFTARSPRFVELVRSWSEAGVVRLWEGPFHTLNRGSLGPDPNPGERWVGTPRMSALARHLAAGLDVECGTRVTSLKRSEGGWQLSCEGGGSPRAFDRVVVATPAPQAVPLLVEAPELAAMAGRAVLEPCFAVMVAFSEPLETDFGGAFVADSPLAWVARQSSKPERDPGSHFVLHASADWSRDHVEAPHASIERELLDAFALALGRSRLPEVSFVAVHRWLYALPSTVLDEGARWQASMGLGVCGDWMIGGRIEAAISSGLALTRAILDATR